MEEETFGTKLRGYRLRARKTQLELADAIGVDFTYISKIEKGKAPPPARERIEAAARFLQLSEAEEIDLLLLADKVPADVQTVLELPGAVSLYRKIQKLQPDEQGATIEHLIDEVERRLRSRPSDNGDKE